MVIKWNKRQMGLIFCSSFPFIMINHSASVRSLIKIWVSVCGIYCYIFFKARLPFQHKHLLPWIFCFNSFATILWFWKYMLHLSFQVRPWAFQSVIQYLYTGKLLFIILVTLCYCDFCLTIPWIVFDLLSMKIKDWL